MPDTLIKRPEEAKTYTISLLNEPEIIAGELITAIGTPIVNPPSQLVIGATAIVAIMYQGNSTVSAGITIFISGGVAETQYFVKVPVTTSGGHTLTGTLKLYVGDGP